jgi:hypothetical protein
VVRRLQPTGSGRPNHDASIAQIFTSDAAAHQWQEALTRLLLRHSQAGRPGVVATADKATEHVTASWRTLDDEDAWAAYSEDALARLGMPIFRLAAGKAAAPMMVGASLPNSAPAWEDRFEEIAESFEEGNTDETVEHLDDVNVAPAPATLSAYQGGRLRRWLRDIVGLMPTLGPYERITACQLAISGSSAAIWHGVGATGWFDPNPLQDPVENFERIGSGEQRQFLEDIAGRRSHDGRAGQKVEIVGDGVGFGCVRKRLQCCHEREKPGRLRAPLVGRDSGPKPVEPDRGHSRRLSLRSSGPGLVTHRRDETANLVWAVEQVTENGVGVPWPGHERAQAVGAAVPEETRAPDAVLRYRLVTPTPEHWVPFVPAVADAARGRSTLQQAALPTTVPAGRLVPDTPEVREESLPRTGLAVTRTAVRSRTPDGGTLLWQVRRVTPPQGESTSGLTFDEVR